MRGTYAVCSMYHAYVIHAAYASYTIHAAYHVSDTAYRSPKASAALPYAHGPLYAQPLSKGR